MNFDLTEPQKILKKAARQFLEAECPKNVVRDVLHSEAGYSPALWAKMTAIGWTGMPFPEKYGGEGASLLDMAVVYEEMGRALLSSPHLSSVILCGMALLKGGGESLRAEFLPGIAGGNVVLTLALTEPDYGWEPGFVRLTARFDGSRYRLKGTKLFVPFANSAHHVLVAARTRDGVPEDSISLFAVGARNSPGLRITPLKGEFCQPLCEVVFDDVPVDESHVVGEVNEGWHIMRDVMRQATVLQCAEVVGAVQYVQELCIAYSNERMQFGQLIGSFQRVQDRIINIVNDADKARGATYQAAWFLDEGLPCDLEVSSAKVLASKAYSTAANEAAHICAGVGFHKDFDLWLYHLKHWTLHHYLGSPEHHRAIVARELLDTERVSGRRVRTV